MLWVSLLNMLLLPSLVYGYSIETREQELFVALRNFSVIILIVSPLVFLLPVFTEYGYVVFNVLMFPLTLSIYLIPLGIPVHSEFQLGLLGMPLTPWTDLDVCLSTAALLVCASSLVGWLAGYYISRLLIKEEKQVLSDSNPSPATNPLIFRYT